jgi:hypothetical protein
MIMTRKEILFESEDEAEINKKESKIGIYEQTNKKKVVNDVVLNPVALGLAYFHFLLSPCRSSSMPDRRKFIHLALCCTGII